eukprot:TRINITY_DN343_c0_g1_i1.p1 TRINITY_DN343_c0_g1~~TRINITY_DN343_c0_g1_i1.p1  ORF type:complete len:404 (-),score=66.75 TRINITY_DN343_c0_g1_i1:1571-2782(-)
MATKNIFIVGAKRTPFGKFGGKLSKFSQTDLAAHASKAALAQARVLAENVDTVILGMVNPASLDAAYAARHVGLRTGVKLSTPCMQINRLCGSGFQSVVSVAQELLLGSGEIGLAVGTESMSQAPFHVYGTRFGVALGTEPKLQDSLWSALTDTHVKMPMAHTAEKLAQQYGITRGECDAFAVESQHRWAAAQAAGVFGREICAVDVAAKGKAPERMETDEHPRGAAASVEGLAKLPPVFLKDGTVTAGNASGICDGAGAIVLATEDAVRRHGLTPLARLVAWHTEGVDPSIMGIGPVPAINGLLAKARLSLRDIDRLEINEAFAAQFLACAKALDLYSHIPKDRVNANGGAIALGHPLGASGSRITAHLVHDLHRVAGKYAIGSACIGGGQGIAILLQRVGY